MALLAASAEPYGEKMENVTVGAYGLKVRGLQGASILVAGAPASWHELGVEQGPFDGVPGRNRAGDEAAELRLVGGGKLLLHRERRLARFLVPEPIGADELAHPYLAAAAPVFALWDGRDSLHAGAFAGPAGAVALLGTKRAGKSTTLAALARAGVPVVTDDVLVVKDGTAFAGPRCIDLRDGGIEGLSGRRVRGDRQRVELPPVDPEVPLRAAVFLTWGDEVALVPLQPHERVRRFADRRYDPTGARPGALLSLAAVPSYELRRPARLEALDAVLELLVRLTAR
jgi:hypothetical protein